MDEDKDSKFKQRSSTSERQATSTAYEIDTANDNVESSTSEEQVQRDGDNLFDDEEQLASAFEATTTKKLIQASNIKKEDKSSIYDFINRLISNNFSQAEEMPIQGPSARMDASLNARDFNNVNNEDDDNEDYDDNAGDEEPGDDRTGRASVGRITPIDNFRMLRKPENFNGSPTKARRWLQDYVYISSEQLGLSQESEKIPSFSYWKCPKLVLCLHNGYR